jgi:hypothetical protein
MKLFSFSVLVSCALLLGGCSTAESGSSAAESPCVGPNCQASAGSKGNYDFVVETGAGGSAGSTNTPSVSETNRCGLSAVGCNPDDVTACAHAAVNVDSSSGGASVGSGTEISSGTSSIGDAGNTVLACRILLDNSVPRSQCEVAGSGLSGDPCVSRDDCAPGYACADDNGTAQCRRYCCGGDDVCPAGTYCDERVVREEAAAAVTLTVPVCMPAITCRFDDPYPCTAEQTCSCPTGRVCGVVRADGTTACVVPGTGLEGDPCPCSANAPCPCAAGHVCSAVLGMCVKTCSLSNAADSAEQCSLGVCQSSVSLPADVGICVSSAMLN